MGAGNPIRGTITMPSPTPVEGRTEAKPSRDFSLPEHPKKDRIRPRRTRQEIRRRQNIRTDRQTRVPQLDTLLKVSIRGRIPSSKLWSRLASGTRQRGW